MQKPIRISLPNHFDGTTVNAWLFKGDTPTLVDTGMKSDKTWEALEAGLQAEGLAFTDLQKIIITHGHADHMGLAARIASDSGAQVWIPEYLLPWAIDLENKLEERCSIYDKAFFSNAEPDLFPYESWGKNLLQFWDPIPEDQLVVFKNDDVIQIGNQSWQTIYTPGHCINQVVFYQPDHRQLLSADMILKSTPVPYLDAKLKDFGQRCASLSPLLASFAKVDALEIDHVYPGHFDEMGSPTALINKQVGRIQNNIEKCLAWIRQGDTTFDTIIQKLYPNRVSDSTFFMVIAILDYLVGQKLVEVREINNKFHYYPIEETVHSSITTKSAKNEF